MTPDEELLAACLSAGPPGSLSHREACRLYRRSVLEWRAGRKQWREEYENRVGLGLLVALVADAADDAGWFIRCGTQGGYAQHIRRKTPVCTECREAGREYDRNRQRVRFWAGTWPPRDDVAEREAA